MYKLLRCLQRRAQGMQHRARSTGYAARHFAPHQHELVCAAEALYAIEGMSQGPLGANWGDGFGTNAEAVSILQQSGLSYGDPNPFFQKLMVRPRTLTLALTLTLTLTLTWHR